MVCDAARLSGLQIDGIISPDEKVGSFKFGIEVVSNHDSLIYSQSLATNVLIGVGLSKGLNYRTEIFEELFKLGIKMPNIIHPSAIIADDSNILQGVQIFAGAIIQPNVTVESGVVVNTKVSIDHGAKIESNCFLGPGVTICGDVTVGAKTLIGAGATILQALSFLAIHL